MRRRWNLIRSTRKSGVPVLAILLVSGFLGAFVGIPQADAATFAWPSAVQSLFDNQRMQFGVSFWNQQDFETLANGTTVAAFSGAIQKYFLPHNIYWAAIYEFNDANTSSICAGTLCSSSEIVNILTAGDAFGMHFIIKLPVWSFDGGGEPGSTAVTHNAWQDQVLHYCAARY